MSDQSTRLVGRPQEAEFYVGLLLPSFLFSAILVQILALITGWSGWWLPLAGGVVGGFLVYLYLMAKLRDKETEVRHQLALFRARSEGEIAGMSLVLGEFARAGVKSPDQDKSAQ